MASTRVVVIDIKKWDENQVETLKQIFSHFANYNEFPANSSIEINNVKYTFAQTIIRRKRDNFWDATKSEFRYEILDAEPIARGADGTLVFNVSATLAYVNGTLIRKNHKARIAKRLSIIEIDAEIEMLAHTPHLRAKPPVIVNNTRTPYGYIVMKKGRLDLHHFLEKYGERLTGLQKIKLAQLACYKYLEQCHGIVHRDIKPENIVIDFDIDDQNNITVTDLNYIDYAYARKEDTPDNMKFLGTPQYMAPEAVTSEITKKSDTLSLGLTLANIFDGGTRFGKYYLTMFALLSNISKITLATTETLYPQLFAQTSDINNLVQNQIARLINNMTAFDPNNRVSVKEAFAELIAIERNHRSYSRFDFSPYDAAQQLRMDLLELQLGTTTKDNHSLEKLAKISDYVKNALEKFNPLSTNISEFVITSGILAFQKLKSKQDIIQRTQDIIASFNENTDRLVDMLAFVEQCRNVTTDNEIKNDANILGEEIYCLLHKERKYRVNLDDMVELNTRYTKKIPALIEKMNELKRKPVTLEQINILHDLEFVLTQMGSTPELLSIAAPTDIIAKLNNNNPTADDDLETVRKAIAKPQNTQLYLHLYYRKTLRTTAFPGENESITQLKSRIKTAIEDYVNKTLTPSNITKLDRAASLERRNDIAHFMQIINKEYQSTEALTRQIDAKLANIRSFRRFSFFKKNELCRDIDKALQTSDMPVKRASLSSSP